MIRFSFRIFVTDSSLGKNFIIFGVDMSSSVQIDKKRKDVLALGKEPTQGLDNTTLTAEAIYPINVTESEKRYVLSLQYNVSGSYLIVNTKKIYQFKAKDSEIKSYPLCLDNISKDFAYVFQIKQKN